MLSKYNQIISKIKEYFKEENCEELFLHGGCFFLANYIHSKIPGSYLVLNKQQEHCAININGKIYDIRGKISSNGFSKATDRNISYMKKNYKPNFNTEKLLEYLESEAI